MLTPEQVKELEQNNNVFIDAASGQYNRESREAVYGWQPLPPEWMEKPEPAPKTPEGYTIPDNRDTCPKCGQDDCAGDSKDRGDYIVDYCRCDDCDLEWEFNTTIQYEAYSIEIDGKEYLIPSVTLAEPAPAPEPQMRDACPKCGGDEVDCEGGSFDTDDNYVRQEITCPCGHAWKNVYTFTGIWERDEETA